MLSNLIEEVRSRRVLAIAALAVLVALALPLLFLKPAPEGPPAADAAAPAIAEEARLPERAARLLATRDADAAAGKAKGSALDPFRPPAANRAAAAKAAAKKTATAPADTPGSTPKRTAGGGGRSPSQPIPVVIQNADGSKPMPRGSSSGGSTTSAPPSTTSTREVAVDIRYGAHQNSRIRRAIPRMKPFYIHGKLVAVFVRYSLTRKKATFAVAPGVHVSGPVNCRQHDGACRYVDIAAGSHVRLTMLSSTRTLVSRRLDVVHTRWRASRSTRAAADDGDNTCLLRKLLAQRAGDVPLERDVCER